METADGMEKGAGVMKQQSAKRPAGGGVLEYSIYGIVVGVCFLILVQRGYEFSNAFGHGGEWDGRAPKLQEGWIPGRRVDVSDDQWRSFRSMIPGLCVVFLLCGLVSRIIQRTTYPMHRVYCVVVWACAMVLLVHGGRGWYVILLVTLNWMWTRIVVSLPLASWQKILSVWILHCGVLLGVRMSGGFECFDALLSFLWRGTSKEMFRWEICYNLTVLRMMSFSLDCIRAMEKNQERVGTRHVSLPSMEFYGYLCSVAHALYPPLYIAGPIITYNDFVRQMYGDDGRVCDEKKAKAWRGPPGMKDILVYASRFVLDLVVMEIMTHYFYFNSIATHRIGFTLDEYTALDVATTGWWVLAFTWLKFTVIWRFFRLAALIEGIEAPENMKKCFAMNYDVQGFWKHWHASFNQWLVQYMYIPLGGSRNQMLMIWPIFFFVAIWHDIEWRLIGWASLMCLAFLPELVVKREFKSSRWDWLRQRPQLLDVVRGMLAAINISALMCGNMVGFVVGMDGLVPLLGQMMASPRLLTVSLASFYCASRLMFVSEKYIYR